MNDKRNIYYRKSNCIQRSAMAQKIIHNNPTAKESAVNNFDVFIIILSRLFFFRDFYLFYYKFIYLIHLFLAALGLRCCAQALFFVVVHGLLMAVASLVAEHGL